MAKDNTLENTVEDHLMLMFALRYALGRESYAPSIVVKNIIKNWDSLHRNTQVTIQKEIKEFFCDTDCSEPDYEVWQLILDLTVKDKV